MARALASAALIMLWAPLRFWYEFKSARTAGSPIAVSRAMIVTTTVISGKVRPDCLDFVFIS
jgi:hypothetical protein